MGWGTLCDEVGMICEVLIEEEEKKLLVACTPCDSRTEEKERSEGQLTKV